MNSKLTLTIEETLIDKAKIYARQKGRSLSDIIESYLQVITADDKLKPVDVSPTVKSLRGSFKLPEGFDYKKELTAILTEKYLK